MRSGEAKISMFLLDMDLAQLCLESNEIRNAFHISDMEIELMKLVGKENKDTWNKMSVKEIEEFLDDNDKASREVCVRINEVMFDDDSTADFASLIHDVLNPAPEPTVAKPHKGCL